MGFAGRGRDPHLIDALLQGGRHFSFFQLVRLLRHANRAGDGSGGAPPAFHDGIRFRVPAALTLPTSAVQAVEAPDGEGDRAAWSVIVNMLGLTGPAGVLPRHYTQELIARAVDADEAAAAFFDLFNQRLLELYYRAWERTKLHVRHERGDPEGPARRLLGVAGVGTPGLEAALGSGAGGLTPDAAAYFAGLLGQMPRSAQAVQQIMTDLLGVLVEVEQFVGVWMVLPPDCQTRLGSGQTRRPETMLGNIVLGACVWDRRSTLRVRIGPLSRSRFASFLPQHGKPSPAFQALLTTVTTLLGPAVRVQIQLILKAADVPVLQLGGGGDSAGAVSAILGQSSWLAGRSKDVDADDTIFG